MEHLLTVFADEMTDPNSWMGGALALLIAAVCLLAPTAALLCRPVGQGMGKRFWLVGAVYEAILHTAALAFSLSNGGFCVAAAVLALGQWFVLREYAADVHRLKIALCVEAALTMTLYILLQELAVIAVTLVLYR